MPDTADGNRAGGLREGVVVHLVSRGFVAESGGDRVRCELHGLTKGSRRETTHPVAVGDLVRFTGTSPGEGVLEEVLPQRSRFSRMAPDGRFEQVLAANADAVLVITSTEKRLFRPGLVDRVLAAAELSGIEGWVCLNKTDLPVPGEVLGTLAAWSALGYRTFRTSAQTGEGVEELRTAVAGKTVVLLGHSGVGKSSLLLRLEPGLELVTQPTSRKTGRGRHTTTAPERFRVGSDAFVIDTPGVREFQPFGIDAANLWTTYPEMRERGRACRFSNCRHVGVIECAVAEALQRGEIDAGRFDRYRKFLEDLQNGL